jgi:type I site-specific restriction endonuclease
LLKQHLVRDYTTNEKRLSQQGIHELQQTIMFLQSSYQKASLEVDQMAFLNEAIEFLVRNGTMEPEALFEASFTNTHNLGVAGIFNEKMSKQVIAGQPRLNLIPL